MLLSDPVSPGVVPCIYQTELPEGQAGVGCLDYPPCPSELSTGWAQRGTRCLTIVSEDSKSIVTVQSKGKLRCEHWLWHLSHTPCALGSCTCGVPTAIF